MSQEKSQFFPSPWRIAMGIGLGHGTDLVVMEHPHLPSRIAIKHVHDVNQGVDLDSFTKKRIDDIISCFKILKDHAE